MYRVVLALHVVSIISWMAGILYLQRLLVYHNEETEGVVKARFILMEERLSRIITMPAMGMSYLFGVWLLWLSPGLLLSGWLHMKLVLVLALTVITITSVSIRKALKQGTRSYSPRALRLLNEVPTLLMIGIVFLVILKPGS